MPSTLSDPAYRAFVDHLAGLRKRLAVSQAELAQRLARPQSWVSKTERYERRMDPAEFRAWALALGADPAAEFGAASEAAGRFTPPA